MSVALLGRNSLIMTLLLHALSRLGIRTTLLSTDLGTEQITADLQKHHYHLIIYDSDLKQIPTELPCIAVTTEKINDILLDKQFSNKRKENSLRSGEGEKSSSLWRNKW